MVWIFTQRSEERLKGVHPDLVKVIRLALPRCPLDFVVLEGRRSRERQRAMVDAGVSQTLRSRHITGHAVDLAPWINDTIPWDDWLAFEQVARTMKQAARELAIPLVWGGDWKGFRDGPHFELPWEVYP